eukprot:3513958-Pyramimonas_sp.AAC.1
MPCEETKRYVQNYMGVVDMRPVTDEDQVKGEDELYSDEELDPRIVEVVTIRKTHVGGAPMEKEDRRTNEDAECEKEKSLGQEATARGDAARGESTSRKNGKRKKHGGDGALRWDRRERQKEAAPGSERCSGSSRGQGSDGVECAEVEIRPCR